MKNWFVIFLMILASCASKLVDNEKSKAEIIKAEKDFAQLAKEKGNAVAFYAFADDSAVIRRGPRVFKGNEAIRNFYTDQKGGELQWSPDFADASGDLGYTYGKFIYAEKDSTGKVNEIK